MDHGKLFDSNSIGVNNSIDSTVFVVDDRVYMIWGSFRGLYGVELTADGLALKDGANAKKHQNSHRRIRHFHLLERIDIRRRLYRPKGRVFLSLRVERKLLATDSTVPTTFALRDRLRRWGHTLIISIEACSREIAVIKSSWGPHILLEPDTIP
ncbi:MAG: hypothetical protein MZU97_23140 [Bacillus subtilis]|nr:hypothetical protein [Bacillus subtilis]